ncbi:MAG: hypothetical protein ACTSSK_16345 [Candidatus Heimdallarchaeota archaeon]
MTQITNIEKQEFQKKKNWVEIVVLSIIGILLAMIISFTFMKTAIDITNMLLEVTSNLKTYFIVTHALFLATLLIGMPFRKIRKYVFFGYVLFLSLSAAVVSIVYAIIPNILIFILFSALIIYSFATRKMNFDLKEVSIVNWILGVSALIIGFGYLHWVDDPIWLNALLYSPLGGVNCPTMIALCGFFLLQSKPRSHLLDFVVGFVTCYFGFFGIFRLGAYVDVALVICGGFLFIKSLVEKIQLTKNSKLNA